MITQAPNRNHCLRKSLSSGDNQLSSTILSTLPNKKELSHSLINYKSQHSKTSYFSFLFHCTFPNYRPLLLEEQRRINKPFPILTHVFVSNFVPCLDPCFRTGDSYTFCPHGPCPYCPSAFPTCMGRNGAIGGFNFDPRLYYRCIDNRMILGQCQTVYNRDLKRCNESSVASTTAVALQSSTPKTSKFPLIISCYLCFKTFCLFLSHTRT